jgi:hypothetical protein
LNGIVPDWVKRQSCGMFAGLSDFFIVTQKTTIKLKVSYVDSMTRKRYES